MRKEQVVNVVIMLAFGITLGAMFALGGRPF